MSPVSWPVLIGTLVIGSPALWAAQVDGTLSPDVALERLLVCALGVWAALSLVVTLSDRTMRSNKARAELTGLRGGRPEDEAQPET